MKTFAFVAIAGLAAAASAQETFSLSIIGAPTTVDTSMGAATFTLDIVGDSSFGTHYLGGAFTIVSNSSLVTNMTWTPAAWSVFNTDDGYAGNGNYTQTIFGQLVLPPFFPPNPGSELGALIGSYQVTVEGDGLLDFSLLGGVPFSLEAVDEVTGQTARSLDGILTLNGASTITVGTVPAPSAMALLGLGGIVAGRRRR